MSKVVLGQNGWLVQKTIQQIHRSCSTKALKNQVGGSLSLNRQAMEIPIKTAIQTRSIDWWRPCCWLL